MLSVVRIENEHVSQIMAILMAFSTRWGRFFFFQMKHCAKFDGTNADNFLDIKSFQTFPTQKT